MCEVSCYVTRYKTSVNAFNRESQAAWLAKFMNFNKHCCIFFQPTSFDNDLTLQELMDRKLHEVTEAVSDTIPRPIAWIDDDVRVYSGYILLVTKAL